ncbi:MAG: hybrid sensor histidine kinase/response regulator [Chryseobacterium sp.]|nr:MAG: hybrid sensor histidine kinase/response regulator [Chryseobacterium sp.]
MLDLCSMILEGSGVPHKCFSSPLDLLNEQWDKEVKYILTDMRMPEMSGTELCVAFKNRIPQDVKVIALTAQVLREEREKVLESGFDGLLIKPFKENQLLSLFGEEFIKDSSEEMSVDRSVLSKMTFGDKEQLAKILQQFHADTLTDKHELVKAMEQDDKDYASLLVHRIAGRTAQIGAKDIASEFRKMEIELSKKELDSSLKLKIKTMLEKLMTLVSEEI